MIYRITLTLLLCAALHSTPARASAVECEGRFVNPITDICWECLFPISIGSIAVSPGSAPDTSNPSMPIQICPMGIFYRVGLAIGYWEPMALTDVTRSPYCMVNMGGINLGVGKIGTGILYTLTAGLFGIGYLVDFIKILCGKFTDKNGNAIRREKK